jgi:hypothetical protein
MTDLVKAPIVATQYLVFAPFLGVLIKNSRVAQRVVFGLMVFITSWHINKFTLMLVSVEKYRGHTKGFESSLIEVLAIALILASALSPPRLGEKRRFLPPGALLYLLYAGVSWLSVSVAPDKLYAVMAGVRFTKCVIIFIGAFHFIREEEDVRFLLKAVAFTLGVQMLVVLKMKYVDHFYQVRGWFEHQNPLAMWAYMCGLPLLAAAMGPVTKGETRWYACGFVASAIIVQSSLSRAALMCFALGVVMVIGLSLIDKITQKRIVFIMGMGAVGALGLLATASTIIARFNDEGNEAAEMLKHSPFGIGWNNFALTINQPFTYGDVIDEWERERGHKVDPDYAKGVVESHYWLLLSETGWGGFITYMIFITVGLWWCVRGALRWRGQFLATYLFGLFAGLLLIYLHSNLERVLTQTKNFSMWFILLGAAARIHTWRPPPKLRKT